LKLHKADDALYDWNVATEDVKRYGKTDVEHATEDTLRCRQIIREVVSFGVNEQQKLKLIYLLALELENRDHMQQLADLVKRIEQGSAKKSSLILK